MTNKQTPDGQKSMISKIFQSELELEQYLVERFGKGHEPERKWRGETIRNYYIFELPDKPIKIVAHNYDENHDHLEELIFNITPNMDRNSTPVFEGTVAEIASILGLSENKSSVRSKLESLRHKNDSVRHSIKDNLYPKTKYAIGAYWRISPNKSEKKKLKFGR